MDTAGAPFTGDQREAERRFRDLDTELRSWAGVAAAATSAMAALVAEAIRDRLWERCGYPSLPQWVALRCGVSAAHARRLIAIAETLEALPLVREKFDAGAISEDHVHEIAKAGVTAFHDHDAADLAAVMTVGQLRKALSFLPCAPDRQPEPEPVPPPAGGAASSEHEWLTYGHAASGRWEIHGACGSERGALIERALDAARDREFRDRHGRDFDPGVPVDTITNVDALLRLAGDALDVADPATRAGRPPSERYLVNIHVHDRGDGRLHLGPRLPTWVTAEISCDGHIRAWLHHTDGSVGLGRRCRVVSDRLRAVIEHRDGGCGVPGCERTRHLHIHHIIHWEHGGLTDPDNLVCACTEHHRDLHAGRMIMIGNPETGTLSVLHADGRPFHVGHPQPPTDETVERARVVAVESPARDGEKCQWKWVDWRPVRPPPPPPPERAPAPPRTYEWPTIDPTTIWPGN